VRSLSTPWPAFRGRRDAGAYNVLLLATINVLNMVDAFLTHVWLTSGYALETNPIASLLGVPGKLGLVAIASLLLYFIRPRALIIPAVALGLVVVYSSIATLVALAP
jgi:formate hydrogenlyase subunit 3/multisubunit Na+/H+ antiporter MnhD subunit